MLINQILLCHKPREWLVVSNQFKLKTMHVGMEGFHYPPPNISP